MGMASLLYRSTRSTVVAAMGGLIPALAIFALFLYLESQQPEGPYYAVVGLTCAILSSIVGIPVAVVTARACRQQARTQPDSK
jgi:threonine/homoserine/homoserine lactone efflux protein